MCAPWREEHKFYCEATACDVKSEATAEERELANIFETVRKRIVLKLKTSYFEESIFT